MKHVLFGREPQKSSRDLEQNIRQSLHQPPSVTDDAHMHDTVLLLRKEICRKRDRRRISFVCFVGKQLSLIGWKLWSIQGVFLLLTCRVLSGFPDVLNRPQSLAKLLFCLSVAVFMTALPLLGRSVRYQMQEVEAASLFSSVKLLLAKLIVIGIGDLSLLALIFFFTLIKTDLPAQNAAFYLCFPFLLASSGCLFMLGHFPPGKFLTGSLLFCPALILVFSVLPGPRASLFQPSFSKGWFLVCILLFAFCASQLCYIVKASSYEEMQLT